MKYKKHEAKEWSMETLRGAVISTIPTTFHDDLEIDEDGVKKLSWHSIDVKADALFAAGNVGEFFSLTQQERKRVAELVVEEVNGEIPTIIQTATPCAKDCVDLCLHAQESGADLVSIITPYFQAKTEQSIYEWFKYVSDRIDIGIVLYNSPLSTPLTAEFIGKLSKDIPNICGVKEGMTDLMLARDIEEACDNKIWVSDPAEEHWLHEISVMTNPVLCCNWIVYFFQTPTYTPVRDYTLAALNGDLAKAQEIWDSLEPMRKILGRVFWDTYRRGVYPIAHFKYWLELYGLPGGKVRTPLLQITEEEKNWLRTELTAAGMLDKVREAAA